MKGLGRIHFLLAGLLFLAGCATPHDVSLGLAWSEERHSGLSGDQAVEVCLEQFRLMDDAIQEAGVKDAQAAPVTGFPYLRTTRFLAAKGQDLKGRGYRDWVNWMAKEAVTGRNVELANLPPNKRRSLTEALGEDSSRVVQRCTDVLKEFDFGKVGARQALLSAVHVPDNYTDFYRVAGLYPLTSLPVLLGFDNWKARNLSQFGKDKTELEAAQLYSPQASSDDLSYEERAILIGLVSQNALKTPRPSERLLTRLARLYAPVWALEHKGEYDRIGEITIDGRGKAQVEVGRPRVYIQPSWAFFEGRVLLQISYLAWFSERPSNGPFDILAGRFDGLIWRVTIGRDGRPLLYDTIHPCGCYHLFFPTSTLTKKTNVSDEPAEGTVVPGWAPELKAHERMVLHVASGSHYLSSLSVRKMNQEAGEAYVISPMDNLRSLEAGKKQGRSLYDNRGLVVGSERAERFLLWPMGIESPGAMRQWGTHATAFVGRRHFDDPHLIEKHFNKLKK